ncbi:MAG TPA: flavodoxin domain-containing protein [Amycolatopsis sp.]|uniref:flavodoxin family protein n=1 Tax=Amycolatopsis sp. TaxID=37632 RepID=UPI002B466A62|nr:flavodoxin domain-containing protein [Amycolatopsis sp.]HKS43634.1 flavodoxin domain-containing protein [Amycolatopsis sp.]
MHAVVIYESMLGNTEKIARAIAEGLSPRVPADVVNVDKATPELAGADLIVVGGPTHVHGMSRSSTRDGARKQASGEIRSATGIREWLEGLGAAPDGALAATFDTRLGQPRWLTGSAARGAAKLLRRHGYRLLVPAESFFVVTKPDRLVDGELDRAHRWGERLADRVAPASPR